jgi:hypothetical protein
MADGKYERDEQADREENRQRERELEEAKTAAMKKNRCSITQASGLVTVTKRSNLTTIQPRQTS